MSVWMLVVLVAVLQCSEANRDGDKKPTIGEQMDIIIKDVSGYLYWLFGFDDDDSVEDQIEASELLTEEFIKDVNEMVELMHSEAEKHIKHVKDIKNKESDNNSKTSAEIINSKENETKDKQQAESEETSEGTSEENQNTSKDDGLKVLAMAA
ncbi:uncharacterized protein LOC132902122 [Amyelois transitella]|uniref:uncharacterized protein LOC132902122 n=1 Tax=Amyelois transitella TaxID=680683 RepID=UPI00298F934C|nr:uncharacterized protein LOC132902122 [Amyelois transitella]